MKRQLCASTVVRARRHLIFSSPLCQALYAARFSECAKLFVILRDGLTQANAASAKQGKQPNTSVYSLSVGLREITNKVNRYKVILSRAKR